MLKVLHTAFPHFAEKTDHGVYQQQVKAEFAIFTLVISTYI